MFFATFLQLWLVAAQQNVLQAELPDSVVDSLYGELVHQSSKEYKLSLLESGQLEPPHGQEYQAVEAHFSTPFEILQNADKLKKLHQDNLRKAAHTGYLQSRSQVRFPHDDDTSDLTYPQNMLGGITTFGAFDTMNCYDPEHLHKPIDIAIVGAPFDTGTSYRPGARFGPESIRMAGKRLHGGRTPVRGNGPGSKLGSIDPYNATSHHLTIIDCGDVSMTPFDNRIALNQLYRAQRAIHNHTTTGNPSVPQPKIITMGGDHTITLMALRSVYEKYGQVAVLHFDSHIDTWDPKVLGGGITDYMSLNHGTFLHYAAENGYLAHDKCFHVGTRAPYIEPAFDQQHDVDCGFSTITARDLDRLGPHAIADRIKKTVGDLPVYISVDIDVLDPANAPATGTMEIGGWTGRELITVLEALEGLDVVGGDVVEVSPPFDTNSGITSLAATAVIDSLLGLIIVNAV